MEGEAYKKEVYLGDIEGIPVYTFTASEKRTDLGVPSVDYFNTILNGLKNLYTEKSLEELEAYLSSAIEG